MRFVLVVGSTATAAIEGISAAGADADLLWHTPAADAELVEYGRLVEAPAVPVSPTGCSTPAVVTRAVRELLGFELLVIDAGIAVPTGAPTLVVGDDPGGDIRDTEPVPNAPAVFESARELARKLSTDELVIGESIPGGTTTALGVLRVLGEPFGVSSSLPENPVALKQAVVEDGLAASGLEEGDRAGDPVRAVRSMGDPTLAALSGLVVGALEVGTEVMLAGGTQLIAAAALVRHARVDEPLRLATTSYVTADGSAGLRAAADAFGLELTVRDPGFDDAGRRAFAGYPSGEAKEGVGMGGALALADRAGVSMDAVGDQAAEIYQRAVADDGS